MVAEHAGVEAGVVAGVAAGMGAGVGAGVAPNTAVYVPVMYFGSLYVPAVF